jgi:hypothetical protein
MQSSRNTESSIFKLFVTLNKLPELDEFIELLIESKIDLLYENLENDASQLSKKINDLFINQDYKTQYLQELQHVKDKSHSKRWVEHQIHTGIFALLNSALFDTNKSMKAYHLLKKTYKCICTYNLNPERLKNYLNKKFEERDGPLSKYTQGKAKYQTRIHPAIKEKIQTLLLALGLEDLHLLSDRATAQIPYEKQRKLHLARTRRAVIFIQELLIENQFDFSTYHNSLIFIENISNIIQIITDENYKLLQYNPHEPPTLELTFLERVNLVKMLSFTRIDDNNYQDITNAFSQEIIRNLENEKYIINVIKPILKAALDYNLEPLAKILSDFITQECSTLSAIIITWVNQHPSNNDAKHYLLEAFDELRFDYDEDDIDKEDGQEQISKSLNISFFDEEKITSTPKKSNKAQGTSPRNNAQEQRSLSTLLARTNTSSQQHASLAQNISLRIQTPSDSVKMFGGTFSLGAATPKKVKGAPPQFSIGIETPSVASSSHQENKASKRTRDDETHSPNKKSKLTPNNALPISSNEQPIGQVTNYFPDFTISSGFINRLPMGAALISHARGYHFYRSNTDNHPYYLVTDPTQRQQIRSDMLTEISGKLLSPATHDAAGHDLQDCVLQSAKALAETTHPQYPSKLHYMQEIYSNTFDRLHRTLAQESIFADYPHKKHPFVSFGDEVTHAARYGFGQKVTGNRFEDRLRPIYYEDGSLENFFVGQLWITLQAWQDYSTLDKFHILSEHAHSNISIDDRILSERETSFWSHAPSGIVALRLPLILPSFFGQYPPQYQQAFGLSHKSFNEYKARIKKSLSPNQAKKQIRQVKNDIIKNVINHYEAMINSAIKAATDKKNSSLVFQGLNNQPTAELPPVDAARVLHIYHKNQQRMDETLAQGVASLNESTLQRCIRLLTAIKKENTVIVVQTKPATISHIRNFIAANAACQLSALVDFVENPANYEKIIGIYRNQERSKLMEADRLLTIEKENVEKLSALPMDMIELFLLTIRESENGNTVFQRLLALSQITHSQFIFFEEDFKGIFSTHFEKISDLVIETLKVLKEKIENYNLASHPNKDRQETIASATANSASHTIANTKESTSALTTKTPLSHAIQKTFDIGREKLLAALKNNDTTNIKKYLSASSHHQILDESSGDTLLHLAVRTLNPEIIQIALTKTSSRIKTNKQGLTPVHLACHSGLLEVFQATYSSSITLNTSHLHQVITSTTSNNHQKRQLINHMFSQGIDISAEDLISESKKTSSETSAFLTLIARFFNAIKDYISTTITTARNPALYKDVCLHERKSYPSQRAAASKLVKLVTKKLHCITDHSLINLLELTGQQGFSSKAIAMILMRVHKEIPYRGRVNIVIAAVIMGDIALLQSLDHYPINFESTPNHRSTFSNKEVKKPITFAIQYARQDVFVFLIRRSIMNSEQATKLAGTTKQHLLAYKKFLSIFDDNASLQQNHPAAFVAIKKCCGDLTLIYQRLLDINSSEASLSQQTPSLQNCAALFSSSHIDISSQARPPTLQGAAAIGNEN